MSAEVTQLDSLSLQLAFLFVQTKRFQLLPFWTQTDFFQGVS